MIVLTSDAARIARRFQQYQEIQAAFDEMNVECCSPLPPRDQAGMMKDLFEAVDLQQFEQTGTNSQ
ncbi:hypothetical protein [Leisingera aquimarina]|uniref:hypothetical protein n=1 Tax=Leisingera aquimarina TaxID=476529 RepID=UPI0004878501|nr:hypothetical protein [Leisingera aquimarina]